jgi:hypothetical protein
MAFMYGHGHCIVCKARISFNIDHVPALRVNGEREPLCRSCHEKWNKIHRTSKGLDPVPLHPEAYAPQEVP